LVATTWPVTSQFEQHADGSEVLLDRGLRHRVQVLDAGRHMERFDVSDPANAMPVALVSGTSTPALPRARPPGSQRRARSHPGLIRRPSLAAHRRAGSYPARRFDGTRPMSEDEIGRIVERITNRIRNSPSEPISDHQLAALLSANVKNVRFFEARLMKWAAFRLEVLHAVLTATPADDEEAGHIAWLRAKLGC
jgi:hypothetical protein